jgi:hypothetical protein
VRQQGWGFSLIQRKRHAELQRTLSVLHVRLRVSTGKEAAAVKMQQHRSACLQKTTHGRISRADGCNAVLCVAS